MFLRGDMEAVKSEVFFSNSPLIVKEVGRGDIFKRMSSSTAAGQPAAEAAAAAEAAVAAAAAAGAGYAAESESAAE